MTINKLTDTIQFSNQVNKINEIIDAIESITVDSELSASSENAVQNKVVTEALNSKQDNLTAGTGLSLSGTTINHTNSITAGMVGTSESSSGSTISIPYISYDSQGHITEKGEVTHTVTGFLTEHQDLSEYAKLTDIPESISSFANDIGYLTEHQDLSEYALLSDIPESVSQLANDSGFITVTDLSGYALSVNIPESLSAFTNDVGYLTEHQDLSEYAKLTDIPESVSALTNDTGYLVLSDLSEYALTSDIPQSVSQLVNDSGFLVESDLSEYALLTDIPESISAFDNDAGYLTETDLSEYALSINIPESLSAFTNDVGYLTEHQDLSEYALLADIPESVSSLTNDAGYLTIADLSEYALSVNIPESISAFANDVGYLTSSDIASVMTYKGTVATYDNLPSSNNKVGDVWNINEDGSNYAWDGSQWDLLGDTVDLSGYQEAITAVTHSSNTAVGSTTQPVYVNSNGVATALDYTIAKSVPSDALFTDTTYAAGTGISISDQGVISNTQTSAEWGNITGTLTDQTDLCEALDAKQNVLIAGNGIDITNNTISLTSTPTAYTAVCPAITPVDGIATWEITHNLNTQAVLVSLYTNNTEVTKNTIITSNNTITVTFKAVSQVTAGSYKIVVLASGNAGVSPTAGQWIGTDVTLVNASRITGIDIDLSSYLPSDNYNYEILLYGQININDGSGTYRNLGVCSSIITGFNSICAIRQNNSTLATTSSTIVLPIGADRKLTIIDRPDDGGNFSLFMRGYRRLGSEIIQQGNSGVDPNFISKDTIINVKLDGSGDFTSIQSAINFLTGKYSNGPITIKIGDGIFEETDLILDGKNYNINKINLIGNGINNTTIKYIGTSNYSNALLIQDSNVTLKDFTFTCPINQSLDLYGINSMYNSAASLESVVINNFTIGARSLCGAKMFLGTGVSVSNCGSAFQPYNGYIYSWYGSIDISDCIYGFVVHDGSIISFTGASVNYINVTTNLNQTKGSVTSEGWITGDNL